MTTKWYKISFSFFFIYAYGIVVDKTNFKFEKYLLVCKTFFIILTLHNNVVQLSVLLHYLLSYMFRPYKAIIRLV